MAGDELTRIDRWLTATLLASSSVTDIVGTRVYGELAPPASSWPFVLFQHQASTDVTTAGRDRIMLDALYLVRGVHASTSFAGDAETLSDAITDALDAASGATTGGVVFACNRERPFRLVELDDGGAQHRHAGALFRIYAQVP